MKSTDDLFKLYQQRLNLHDAAFVRINHQDAMVAIVYKIIQTDGTECILKICTRTNDYLREVYFLEKFADTLPVPRMIATVTPGNTLHGAILMECLPGGLLEITSFTEALAFEMGSWLARIHMNRMPAFGDLIYPQNLKSDPRIHFTSKFEEGLAECSGHLPKSLLEACRDYYDSHLHLLDSTDGPCITHRDFRPGNVIVDHGKIRGIIDWSSARAGFAEEDFCNMEHESWVIHPCCKGPFLEGYSTIAPIPNYSSIMPLLRLSKAIATIGFTVKMNTWESTHASLYQFNLRYLEAFFDSAH